MQKKIMAAMLTAVLSVPAMSATLNDKIAINYDGDGAEFIRLVSGRLNMPFLNLASSHDAVVRVNQNDTSTVAQALGQANRSLRGQSVQIGVWEAANNQKLLVMYDPATIPNLDSYFKGLAGNQATAVAANATPAVTKSPVQAMPDKVKVTVPVKIDKAAVKPASAKTFAPATAIDYLPIEPQPAQNMVKAADYQPIAVNTQVADPELEMMEQTASAFAAIEYKKMETVQQLKIEQPKTTVQAKVVDDQIGVKAVHSKDGTVLVSLNEKSSAGIIVEGRFERASTPNSDIIIEGGKGNITLIRGDKTAVVALG